MIPTLIVTALLSSTHLSPTITEKPENILTTSFEGNSKIDRIKKSNYSNKCDDYDCHIEIIPSDFCTVPIKGPFDTYCEIPCQIDNCTQTIEFGNTCLDFICQKKDLFTNPTSTEVPLMFVTTLTPKNSEVLEPIPTLTESDTTPRSLPELQESLFKIQEEDPCDNFVCHVESVPSDFCTVPVKGPYDINCWIPCAIDNCTKEIEPGINFMKAFKYI